MPPPPPPPPPSPVRRVRFPAQHHRRHGPRARREGSEIRRDGAFGCIPNVGALRGVREAAHDQTASRQEIIVEIFPSPVKHHCSMGCVRVAN